MKVAESNFARRRCLDFAIFKFLVSRINGACVAKPSHTQNSNPCRTFGQKDVQVSSR